MREALMDPQVWATIVMGVIIGINTLATRFQDSSKRRMNRYKKDSALLLTFYEYTYDVYTKVVRHNRESHPDGTDALQIPPVPGDNDDS